MLILMLKKQVELPSILVFCIFIAVGICFVILLDFFKLIKFLQLLEFFY